MSKINIHCPSCQQNGVIRVEGDDIKDVSRGLLAVNIPSNSICEHTFIAYIDKSFKVRDYFIADFRIKLPEITIPKEIETKIPSSEIVDVFLIKLNLSGILLTNILKSIFSKQKIVLILDDLRYGTSLITHILKFFEYITEGSFDADVSVISKGMYNRSEWKKHIVFEGNNIIRNANKFLDLKNIKIEQVIVHNFLAEVDENLNIFFLRNEIQKAYELSKLVIELDGSLKEKEDLTSKKIIDHIKESRGIKMSFQYLKFLIEIVKNYFDVKISISSIVSDFLGF